MGQDTNLNSRRPVDAAQVEEILARGMSPRQRTLDRNWRYYTGTQHEAKQYDWSSQRRPTTLEAEAIRQGGGRVLPGQYVAGNVAPYAERYPNVRYRIARRITKRFTGLMFAGSHIPKIKMELDEDTEEWTRALLQAAQFWTVMAEARDFGGGQGSAVVSYGFEDGKLVVEAHDPRWCFPEFKNRRTRDLKSLEIRFMYCVDIRDTETGLYRTTWFWFRRVIDEVQDVTYAPALVTVSPTPPEWEVENEVLHGFGECPAVWTHNEKTDEVDGAPDLQDASFDIIDEMDKLATESTNGVVKNIDPTVVLKAEKTVKELDKGSDNCLQVGPNGDARYMTLQAGAVEEGRKQWQVLRDVILEIESCVLDLTDLVNATATEIHKKYEAMEVRIAGFQTQYTNNLIIPLVQKILRSARTTDGRVVTKKDGTKRKLVLRVAPKVVKQEDGSKVLVQRKMGTDDGETMTVEWPPLSTPGLDDIVKATNAATSARAMGQDPLIDKVTLIRFLARYFGEENAQQIVDRLAAEKKQTADEAEEAAKKQAAALGQGQLPAPAGAAEPDGDEGANKDLAEQPESQEGDSPELDAIIEATDYDAKSGKVTMVVADFVRLTSMVSVPKSIQPE